MLGAHNPAGIWYWQDGRLSGREIATIMADTFITSLMSTSQSGERRAKTEQVADKRGYIEYGFAERDLSLLPALYGSG